MTMYQEGDAAIARNGDVVTIMLAPSPEVATELRRLLAKVNSERVGDTSEGLRQLLDDTEAVLQAAFRVRRARPKRLRAVCMIPNCGCSGFAHA